MIFPYKNKISANQRCLPSTIFLKNSAGFIPYHFFSEKSGKGFTLVELLVVVSIIGLISSVVLSALNTARIKARYAGAKVEISQFIKAVVIAQGEQTKTLLEITGSGCSDCSCRSRDIRNIPTSDACYIRWLQSLTAVQTATNGIVTGIDEMKRDPWGSPYGLDENEGEWNCNRIDTIRSAGPDGRLYNGDDQGYLIPQSGFCP